MFVSLLELALGAITIGLIFGWFVLDNRWLSGRIDQLDDDLDRYRGDTAQRLERVEDWVKFFERVRGQAGEPTRFVVTGNTVADISDPGEVPTDVPEPTTQPIATTQPDGIAIQVQSALIERPSAVPRGESDEAKARKAAWVEEQLAEIRARIDAATKESA